MDTLTWFTSNRSCSFCRPRDCKFCQGLTSRPPNPCRRVEGHSCHACNSLSEIDKQIEETQKQLQKLKLRRQQALVEINASHDPFASRLSQEIASKIFTLCLSPFPDATKFHQANSFEWMFWMPRYHTAFEAVNTLCKNWRKIACSTPQLWNKICIEHFFRFPNINPYLQRSGNLPLDIYLRGGEFAHTPAIDGSDQRFANALGQHSSRWRRLCLQAPHHLISAILRPNGIVIEAQNLEVVVVQALTDRYAFLANPLGTRAPTAPPQASFFQIASSNTQQPSPSLFTLYGLHISPHSLDYTRLRFVNLEFVTITSFRHVLLNSPILVTLEVQLTTGDQFDAHLTSQSDTLTHITHATLTSLTMKMVRDLGVKKFESISLPSLKYLEYQGCNLQPENQIEIKDIYDLLRRSQCPMETLILHLSCQEENLIQLLQLVPDLRTLDINHSALSDKFFEVLGQTIGTTSVGESNFIPRLHRFHFRADQVSKQPFDWSLIHTMMPETVEGALRRPLLQIVVYVRREQCVLTEAQGLDLVKLMDSGVELFTFGEGYDKVALNNAFHGALQNMRERSRPPNPAQGDETFAEAPDSGTSTPRQSNITLPEAAFSAPDGYSGTILDSSMILSQPYSLATIETSVMP